MALLVIAAVALASSVLLWQRLETIQQELARRSTDAGTQAIEARTLARQAQEGMQELSARLSITETRLGEVSLQRTQLEELMQSLSRTRDENLVVDLESALRLAQQQAQLTGSAEPLLAALKTAEQRLARAAQPRLSPVQRAVARDAERIKSAVLTDVPALLMKVDELTRMVDELPVANAFVTSSSIRPATTEPVATPAATPASDAQDAHTENAWYSGQALRSWVIGALASVRGEAAQLLRVSRIDQPEAALLAPEQAFFLRENLKLKLLNARMALLSRQTDTARADLLNVQATLARYYDPASRRTQATMTLLQQVQGQLKNSELPRLDETLAALATAAAGR
jgi:uroporphyrin-3 C-methyltransferase